MSISVVNRTPKRSPAVSAFEQVGGFSSLQSRIVCAIRKEQPGTLVNLSTVPMPHMVDVAKFSSDRDAHAEFFLQFPADGLFRAFTVLNSTARRSMEHNAGRRVLNLGHEEILLPADNAKRRLSDLYCHGVRIFIIAKIALCETDGTADLTFPCRPRPSRLRALHQFLR